MTDKNQNSSLRNKAYSKVVPNTLKQNLRQNNHALVSTKHKERGGKVIL